MKKLGIVVTGALLSFGSFAADDGVTLGGYVDAGWSTIMQDKSDIAFGGKADVADMNGFAVREGALYIGKKWSNWEVFSDVAFGSYKVADTQGNFVTTGGIPGTTTDVNFVTLSQAFIMANHENGFSWKLGKFDGLYGYYSGRQDSWAHRLTDQGYLQKYLPAQHLGWAGTYAFSDMLTFTVLAANDDEKAVSPATGAGTKTETRGTRSPDLGVKVNANFDMFTLDVGALFMTGDANKPAVADQKDELGYAVTALVEGKLNPVTLGVYALYYKEDYSKAGADDVGNDFGFGVNAAWDHDKQWGITARGEYVSVNSGNLYDSFSRSWFVSGDKDAFKSVINVTVGPHWNFNDNIVAKLDYTFTQVDGGDIGGVKVDVDPIHTVNAGVVAHF